MSCSRLMITCNVFQKVVRYGSNFCPSCTKRPFLSAPVYSARTMKYYSAQSHEETTVADKSEKDGDGPQTCNADSDKEAAAASAALNDKNVQLEKKIKELEDKYKRSLAENENLRARMVRQLEEVKLFSLQAFCKDLLEIADILHLAADSVSEEVLKNSQPELKNLHDGVLLTNTQLLKIFQKYGVTPVNPINEKFNPNFHEAVFEVPDPVKEPGTVAVVQKIGYMLHQRCLRAAQVGVVKAQL